MSRLKPRYIDMLWPGQTCKTEGGACPLEPDENCGLISTPCAQMFTEDGKPRPHLMDMMREKFGELATLQEKTEKRQPYNAPKTAYGLNFGGHDHECYCPDAENSPCCSGRCEYGEGNGK